VDSAKLTNLYSGLMSAKIGNSDLSSEVKNVMGIKHDGNVLSLDTVLDNMADRCKLTSLLEHNDKWYGGFKVIYDDKSTSGPLEVGPFNSIELAAVGVLVGFQLELLDSEHLKGAS
jgi:hypothetical protein